MDISEQKKEILNLLERLNTGERPRELPSGGGRRAGNAPGLHERILRRRQELVELRNRRDRLGQDLLEERLLGICQMLEQRISRIEAVMMRSEPVPRSEGQPVQTSQPVMAAGVDESAAGMDVADEFNGMMPDLDISTATVSESAGGNQGSSSGREQVHTLSGLVQEGILPDILQMISSNAKTGIFSLEKDENRIDLFLRDGELYHALGEGMEGQSAFFAAMAMTDGQFFFEETDGVPDEKTIDGNTQFLILEALRQIDEDGGGQ